jgi:hypothetical protein
MHELLVDMVETLRTVPSPEPRNLIHSKSIVSTTINILRIINDHPDQETDLAFLKPSADDPVRQHVQQQAAIVFYSVYSLHALLFALRFNPAMLHVLGVDELLGRIEAMDLNYGSGLPPPYRLRMAGGICGSSMQSAYEYVGAMHTMVNAIQQARLGVAFFENGWQDSLVALDCSSTGKLWAGVVALWPEEVVEMIQTLCTAVSTAASAGKVSVSDHTFCLINRLGLTTIYLGYELIKPKAMDAMWAYCTNEFAISNPISELMKSISLVMPDGTPYVQVDIFKGFTLPSSADIFKAGRHDPTTFCLVTNALFALATQPLGSAMADGVKMFIDANGKMYFHVQPDDVNIDSLSSMLAMTQFYAKSHYLTAFCTGTVI